MLTYLRCVGNALVAVARPALTGSLPFEGYRHAIAQHVIDQYQQQERVPHLLNEVEAVLAADLGQARADAKQIASEWALGSPAREIDHIASYLALLPVFGRQFLRGADHPSGGRVPPTLNVRDPLQLAMLFPRRMPRFGLDEVVPHAPQWRFAELLASDDFWEIWLARHQFLDQRRTFAFCLDPIGREQLVGRGSEAVQQFMAASARTGDHTDGIVPMVDAHLEGELPWLAYEHVEGQDWWEWARELAELPPVQRGEKVLQWLRAVATVLGYFHRLPDPIVHGNLEPAQLLQVKRLDPWHSRVVNLGLHHFTSERDGRDGRDSSPASIPNVVSPVAPSNRMLYMSPQQLRGAKPRASDDVFALGIMAYQLLVGDPRASRPSGKWRKRVSDCQLSHAVLDLLECCWDDDVAERPKDAAALADSLRDLGLGRGSDDQPIDVAEIVSEDPDPPPAVFSKAQPNEVGNSAALLRSPPTTTAGKVQDPLTEPDTRKIAELERAAATGNADAMFQLAALHDNRSGEFEDGSTAFHWYQQAADAGHVESMVRVAMCYQHGQGTTPDSTRAFQWYQKAADTGDTDAMTNVALMYRDGVGVEKNGQLAKNWYIKAASEGHVGAMYVIALMYRDGREISKDHQAAHEWFHRAAEAGNHHAM